MCCIFMTQQVHVKIENVHVLWFMCLWNPWRGLWAVGLLSGLYEEYSEYYDSMKKKKKPLIFYVFHCVELQKEDRECLFPATFLFSGLHKYETDCICPVIFPFSRLHKEDTECFCPVIFQSLKTREIGHIMLQDLTRRTLDVDMFGHSLINGDRMMIFCDFSVFRTPWRGKPWASGAALSAKRLWQVVLGFTGKNYFFYSSISFTADQLVIFRWRKKKRTENPPSPL